MPKVRICPEYPELVVSSCGKIMNHRDQWQRTFDDHGYRRFNIPTGPKTQRTVMAHVVVCTAFHGPQPTPGHEVAHGNGVHNRAENLRWATKLENAADTIKHGRTTAKLTVAEVQEIRRLLRSGTAIREVARAYEISKGAVQSIKEGKTWKHVPEETQ